MTNLDESKCWVCRDLKVRGPLIGEPHFGFVNAVRLGRHDEDPMPLPVLYRDGQPFFWTEHQQTDRQCSAGHAVFEIPILNAAA